VSYSLTPQKHW